MSVTELLFWFLSFLAVGSALMVVASKSPVHSILYLIVTFFAISGHYVLMNAQFLAIVNIIVYAGAIMVLFLFVVMLMNLNADTEPPKKNRFFLLASVVAGCSLLLVVVGAMRQAEAQTAAMVRMKDGDIGLIANLGKSLFTDFVLPFEISSVLFLSAMVGAVVIGKKEA
jgi:NADH-quinone oxidoreductase subunit J